MAWPNALHRSQNVLSGQSFPLLIAMHLSLGLIFVDACWINAPNARCRDGIQSSESNVKYHTEISPHWPFKPNSLCSPENVLTGIQWQCGDQTAEWLEFKRKQEQKKTYTENRSKKEKENVVSVSSVQPVQYINRCMCVFNIVHICEKTTQIPWTSCYDGNSISANFDSKCIFK